MITKLACAKAVAKAINSIGGDLSLVPQSGAPAVDETFSPKFFQHTKGCKKVEVANDWNLIDCRMTLDGGGELVVGLPWDAVEGNTKLDKFNIVCGMEASAALQIVENAGFAFKSVPHQLYALPPNHIIITLQEGDDCNGIRWPMSGNQKIMEGSMQFLEELLVENPSLSEGTAGGLLKHFTKVLDGMKQGASSSSG